MAAESAHYTDFTPSRYKGRSRLQVLREFFGTMPVRVSIVLGEGTVSLGEFTSLARDSILKLEQHAGEPVKILANGMLIAEGEVVTLDGKYGVKIRKILDAPSRSGANTRYRRLQHRPSTETR